jgi:hypothetical protein
MFNRPLVMLGDLLRKNRAALKTRWRRLEPGRQALLVLRRRPPARRPPEYQP